MPATAHFELGEHQRTALANSQRMIDALVTGLNTNAEPVRVRETHISWIMLTGDLAYKVKKPLNLGFLDFSSLASRRDACYEELRLNKRMAASIYLGVIPITGTVEQPQFGGNSPALDYAVQMRRFPDDATLDAQLAENRLTESDMEQLAATLADFHAQLPPTTSDFGSPDAIWQPALDNFRAFDGLPEESHMASLVRNLEATSHQLNSQLTDTFADRQRNGCIRECHGDFHTGNLVRLATGITGFDALEFDPALRWIDVMSEVAFLVMDLEAKAHAELAYRFLNRYLQITGDFSGLSVLHFYISYRAMVRAKVQFIMDAERQDAGAAEDPEIIGLLRLAKNHLDPAEPRLLLTTGLSGSGKTTIARQVAAQLPAIHIRSDIERKRMHDVAELTNTGSGVAQGIYAADSSTATYAELARLAVVALESGFSVLVDAACLQIDQRRLLLDVANRLGCAGVILEIVAPAPILEERIRARSREGGDASEADIAVLRYQLEHLQVLTEEEKECCIQIDSSVETDYASLLEEIQRRCRS